MILALCLAWSIALRCAALAADGDSTEVQIAEGLSGAGTFVFLGLGAGLPLLEGSECGKEQAFRTADAGMTAVLASELLKRGISSERPDGSGDDSFPSTHTSAAFAVAAMQADFQPEDALWWYAGASAIAWSRLRLDKHRVEDVLAGAALGYGVAQLEMSLPDGILLRPWIGDDDCMGCVICWEP